MGLLSEWKICETHRRPPPGTSSFVGSFCTHIYSLPGKEKFCKCRKDWWFSVHPSEWFSNMFKCSLFPWEIIKEIIGSLSLKPDGGQLLSLVGCRHISCLFRTLPRRPRYSVFPPLFCFVLSFKFCRNLVLLLPWGRGGCETWTLFQFCLKHPAVLGGLACPLIKKMALGSLPSPSNSQSVATFSEKSGPLGWSSDIMENSALCSSQSKLNWWWLQWSRSKLGFCSLLPISWHHCYFLTVYSGNGTSKVSSCHLSSHVHLETGLLGAPCLRLPFSNSSSCSQGYGIEAAAAAIRGRPPFFSPLWKSW